MAEMSVLRRAVMEQGMTRASSPPSASVRLTGSAVIFLFLLSIVPPIYFYIGDIQLTATRVVLLVVFIPLLLRLLSGKAGRLMAIDYMMALYLVWLIISVIYHSGLSRIGFMGSAVIEQAGGYLIGRTLILHAADYRYFLRAYFVTLLILLPFALVELFTNRNLWVDVFRPFFETSIKGPSSYGRMGLERVISGFEHPILFGLFCSLGVANFFYAYRDHFVKALSMASFSGFMTFMSLSSAPLLAVAIQVLLILWDLVTRGKWVLLTILSAISYVVIDALSNRTPVSILISTLTFNANSAWTRVAQWNHGSAAVLDRPFFGVADNSWSKPGWLVSSIDNFWLVVAFRHGIPAVALLIAAIVLGAFAIMRTKGLSAEVSRYRTGYMIGLLGLCFSLCTVHIWGDTSSFVFCYLGAAMWICNAAQNRKDGETPEVVTAASPGRRAPRVIQPPLRPAPIDAMVSRNPQEPSPASLPKTRFPPKNSLGPTDI